ncbi:hypothetical protein OH77DRAFT_173781 [Trametes cingulata]|nr:hypothetical protein OH77DRAFT_173781 [Trametes cingulata]
MCAQAERNRLKKAPATSSNMAGLSPASATTALPSQGRDSRSVLRRPMPVESRTMSFARQMQPADSPRMRIDYRETPSESSEHSSGRTPIGTTPPLEPPASEHMLVRKAPERVADTSHISGSHGPVSTPGVAAPSWNYFMLFQHYMVAPVDAVARSVTAIEHHWAIRAARAEALLDAHERHKRELSTLSETLEERRARDLAAVGAKYEKEFARHRQMWIVLGAAASMVAMLLFVLLRHTAPAGSSSRWLGPLHFTIPILSLFASVIEHETSAVNVRLVALLLLAGGTSAVLWARCGRRTR